MIKLNDKLVQAGVSEKDTESMDRTTKMERWAQIILSGVDQPVSEAMVAVAGGLGYDVELERKKTFV
jgi:hypothetical protein